MIGAANVYNVWITASIVIGFLIVAFCVVVAIVVVNTDREILPWGHRAKLNREKSKLEYEATQVKLIQTQALREATVEAAREKDLGKLAELSPAPPQERYR